MLNNPALESMFTALFSSNSRPIQNPTMGLFRAAARLGPLEKSVSIGAFRSIMQTLQEQTGRKEPRKTVDAWSSAFLNK